MRVESLVYMNLLSCSCFNWFCNEVVLLLCAFYHILFYHIHNFLLFKTVFLSDLMHIKHVLSSVFTAQYDVL